MSDDLEGTPGEEQAGWPEGDQSYDYQQTAYAEPEQAAWQEEAGWQEGTQYESQYAGAYPETDQPGTQIEEPNHTLPLEPGPDLSLEPGQEPNLDLSSGTGETSVAGEPSGSSDGKPGQDEEEELEMDFEGSAEDLRASLQAQFPDGEFEIEEVEEGAA